MKENKKYYLSLIFIFILMFMLNVLSIKTSSDYKVLTTSFSDILSTLNIFKYISYLLTRLPKLLSSLINTLVFIGLVILVNKDKKDNILFTFCVLFISIPYFGYTVLNKANSSEYLYFIACLLLVLKLADKKISKYLLLFISLILGFNSLNIISIISIIIYILVLCVNDNKDSLLYILLGLSIGKIINLTINNSFNEFINVFNFKEIDLTIFIILIVVFAVSLITHKLIKNQKVKNYTCACLLLGLVYIVNNLLSVNLLDSLFVIVVLSINKLSSNLIFNKDEYNIAIKVAIIFMCFNCYYAFVTSGSIYLKNNKRESYIGSQISNGNLNPVVEEFNIENTNKYTSYYIDGDLAYEKDNEYNVYYSTYRGLESIKTTTKKVFESVFENGLSTLMNIQDINEYFNYLKENNIAFLITTSNLSDGEYESLKEVLKDKYNIENINGKYIVIIGKGEEITYIDSNEGEFGYNTQNDNGDFLYLCSLDQDGAYSIITINDNKYSLDYDGVKIVSYDENSTMILDSVVFNGEMLKANR